MSFVVVSLHDVAPATWEESRRLLGAVEARGMQCSILVVPGPWRGVGMGAVPGFARWVCGAVERGHEPILHGWSHEATVDGVMTSRPLRRWAGRVATRGCAEFLALGGPEARRRLEAGLETLARHGLAVDGFTPPGWWASPETDAALGELGFRYTTTRRSVLDLVSNRRIDVSAVCQRPGSPLTRVGARVVQGLVARAVSSRDPLRVALHPDDLHDPRLDGATDRLLDVCASAATSLTYSQLVDGASPRRETP